MPWTGKTFKDKHNKSLTPAKATKAAKQANAILASTGNEGMAIATANKQAAKPAKVQPVRTARKRGAKR